MQTYVDLHRTILALDREWNALPTESWAARDDLHQRRASLSDLLWAQRLLLDQVVPSEKARYWTEHGMVMRTPVGRYGMALRIYPREADGKGGV
jgi:hypothetical protein